jgi:hypothetical protein
MGNDSSLPAVQITLGGHLSFFDAHKRSRFSLCLEEATSLTNLLDRLGVPPSEVFLVAINGQQQAALTDVMILPGDAVSLYPPMGGG